MRVALALLLVLITADLVGQIPLNEHLSLYGDIRGGYFGTFRDERDGSRIDDHDIRLRPRIGFIYRTSPAVDIRIRYALRWSYLDGTIKPGLSTTSPGAGGLSQGEGAFDEAFVTVRRGSSVVRFGRFQTGFTLPGVIGNSIQRNDSPNLDVQWTDGLWVTHRLRDGWQADVILQSYLARNAPGNEHRFPLQVDADAFPVGVYGSLQKTGTGLMRLIGADVVVLPRQLRVADGRADHATIGIKGAMGWRLGGNRDLIAGSEAVMAVRELSDAELRLSPEKGLIGRRFGWQANASLRNMAPGHHLGFVAGITSPMMLTSADYWNNGWMWEVRHQWVRDQRLSFETRLRVRGDDIRRSNALRRRVEAVPYARFTYRLR